MKDEKVKQALIGAAVGLGLGEVLDGNKTLLMLAGAAIGASIEGKEVAKNLDMDQVYVKDGFLVRESPSGDIVRIKEIKRSKAIPPSKEFKI